MRRGLLAAVVFLTLAGCADRKADTVVIVAEGGNARIMGKVEFTLGGDGSLHPNVWKKGNVMVFRATEQVGDQRGEAGFAYRVDAAGKLVQIERVDLTRSDDQLASRYGVKAAPKKK
jgi:hypothetical protein